VQKGTPTGVKIVPRAGWESVVASKEHAALALEAAEKNIVLLKNKNGLLPLDRSRIKSIAVIGPNADAMVLGGYSNKPPYFVSVLDGIRKLAGEGIKVSFARGCGLVASPEDDIPAAVALAKDADVSIVVVGTARTTMGENLDRASLDLTGAQQQLVEAVQATGKPVVVVLINGGALTIPWIDEHVPAILEAWYAGQETGTAVANVLFGKANPGGKLPVTFPSTTGMVPCYYNAMPPGGPQNYQEGKFHVLYPFGYGLSYTTFEFSKPELDLNSIAPDGKATLRVKVTNTGKRAGDEVVQMYVKRRYASTVRPEKELKGFQRIALAPGETREVSIPVGFEQLKSWLNGQWTVEPGEFVLAVGPDSVNTQDVSLKVE
jgi:beta-glucosidase